MLLNLGEPGDFDITPWAHRVVAIDAKDAGDWELPVLGQVAAPAAMLSGHGGRSTGRPSCRCAAYNWPHRPGGGLCRWPDEPEYWLTTPAGTHGSERNRRRRTPWLDRLPLHTR